MFSRRWLINYFLIVLIILATYIGNKYDVQTGYQEDLRITALSPSAAQNLQIQTADGSYNLQRQSNNWFLMQPVTWPANNINIERILGILEMETDSRLPAGEIDLNELGLKFPRAILRIDNTEILFGDTNNIGARRYILLNNEVFLLADAQLALMSGGLAGFADRRLLPPAIGLSTLNLPGLTLQRQASGGWLTADVEASPDQLNTLINNWQGLQARRVQAIDESLTPRNKIRATSDQQQTFEFYLLSIDPELVIANPSLGLQYHFDASQYYGLLEIAER